MTTIEDAKKMKVQELKDELENRGLPTTGLKAELLDRLTEAMGGGAAGDEDVAAGTTEEAVEAPTEEPPAPAAEPAAVEEAPPAEVAAEPVMEAPVAEAVAEAVEAAVEAAPAGETVVVVETTVETEEPAAPEVPQPMEGAMLTEAPAAEQPSSEQAAYDAVAAQQAASAIAAKFAQQHAATEGDGPADDLASGKRKYEEDVSADPLGDEHARKRTSFTGPEGAYNGGGGFSDAPSTYIQPAVAAPMAQGMNGSDGGQIAEVVDIPATMVGKLIGKAGETIKQLQYSTNTKVQIDHQTPGDTKRVTIFGSSREAVMAAKGQVEQIVTTDDAAAGGVAHSVECPQGIVGRIIGRGGETIRALQQASQAHIVVDQNYPEGQPRRVNISGRQDAVDRAAKMVQELISGEPGSAQSIIQKYGAGVTKEIICPKNMVGRVIGKGGETIKALQKNFGCNIQIDQTIDPMKVTVAGQPGPVESAAAAVTEIINGGNPYLGPPGGAGGGGYGDPAGGRPGYGGGGGYGAPQYPAAGGYGGGYGAFPQAQPQYGAYNPYGQPAYPQPYAQPQAAYGGYPGYGAAAGADPYAGQAAAGGYGGGYGGGAAAGGGGASQWQELHDEQGRAYYYNNTTGASQWEKPADFHG